MSKPLSYFGPYARIVGAFVASAFLHASIFSMMDSGFIIWPYLASFGGFGVVCALERGYGKLTGRRVGGWAGRIWMWSCMLVVSEPIVAHMYANGWAGCMRGSYGTMRWMSLVEWSVWALGLGPSPLEA